ncbi:uncharacterized protein LOC129584559 isoform X2 [Paramacrobiotus metropolitanus]|uniref:uncharacterized protein LOC129584559 isoform X2 n=1 Tax=Paramacrobiotus metropolitanus TaxID=2943436 RepID=UPI002445A256|nr:uncharacterized protein LOC129584559 isoform X2 [Paramacrobiotus metropolitanus]
MDVEMTEITGTELTEETSPSTRSSNVLPVPREFRGSITEKVSQQEAVAVQAVSPDAFPGSVGRWRLRDMSISEDEANICRSWSSSAVGSPRSPTSSVEDSPQWQSSPAAGAGVVAQDASSVSMNGYPNHDGIGNRMRIRESPLDRQISETGRSLAESVSHDGLLDSFSMLATSRQTGAMGTAKPPPTSYPPRPSSPFAEIVPRNAGSIIAGQRLLDSTRNKNMWKSALVDRKIPLLGLSPDNQTGQMLPAINRIVHDEASFSAAECHGEREMHQKFRLSRSCNDLCFPASATSHTEKTEKDNLSSLLTNSMQIDSTTTSSEKAVFMLEDKFQDSPTAMSEGSDSGNGNGSGGKEQWKSNGSPAVSVPADSPEPAMSPVGFFTTPGSPGAAGTPLGMRPRSGSQSPYRRTYTSPNTVQLRQSVLNAKRKRDELDESMEDVSKRPCKGDNME